MIESLLFQSLFLAGVFLAMMVACPHRPYLSRLAVLFHPSNLFLVNMSL